MKIPDWILLVLLVLPVATFLTYITIKVPAWFSKAKSDNWDRYGHGQGPMF